jgi:glycosyltransferase involved in cell wall biosynthesis
MRQLSICIPTYNRAGFLGTTLASITAQARFQKTEDVEIVISDNCSEDQTRQVCEQLVERHGEKVRYFRNDTNIRDRNFELALSRGRGAYLKLNNDNLVHEAGSLDAMVRDVEQHGRDRPQLFYGGGALRRPGLLGIGSRRRPEVTRCADTDHLVRTVSYFLSWIGGFGIWREDFESLPDFSRCAPLQLAQVDVLLRLSGRKATVVDNRKLFRSLTTWKRGGYNLFTVFVDNYCAILDEHRDRISERTLRAAKRDVLLHRVAAYAARTRVGEGYTFDLTGEREVLQRRFGSDPVALARYAIAYQGQALKVRLKRLAGRKIA